MAKVKPGSLFDGLSGKLGGFVFCTGANGTIVKVAPKVRSVHKPTVSQQAARARFNMANKFLVRAGRLIRLAKGSEENISPALTVKNLMNEVIRGQYPNFFIDYTHLKVSAGTLTTPKAASIKQIEDRIFAVRWGNRKRSRPAEVIVAMYSPLQDCWEIESSPLNSKCMVIEIPRYINEVLECYLFFRYRDGTRVSDSMYLGSVVCAQNSSINY
ncbi:DUF6266 family protein [Pseudopedobacter beijingensis]|uniref:DUF6266 family protein n=1 Tax=Pseudopedobacter beijingensis TaxID=1207056 RepID=A0ABW4I8D8_9SPHI